MQKKAFTLVELLVAMAIIGVLLGLAVFGLAAAQQSQRDTQRKSALNDLAIGYQTYLDKANATPAGFVRAANNNIQFCSALAAGACAAGATIVEVPLASITKATGLESVLTPLATADTTNNQTSYCIKDATRTAAYPNNPIGIVFCARLENGSTSCQGPGAVKGNTVTCFSTAVNF